MFLVDASTASVLWVGGANGLFRRLPLKQTKSTNSRSKSLPPKSAGRACWRRRARLASMRISSRGLWIMCACWRGIVSNGFFFFQFFYKKIATPWRWHAGICCFSADFCIGSLVVLTGGGGSILDMEAFFVRANGWLCPWGGWRLTWAVVPVCYGV